MIKHIGDKWVLFTKDGSRRLGTHDTEEEALAQERAIEASKHRHAAAIEYSRLLAETDLRACRKPSKDEHPFTYCMEVVVPAMAREGREPDDPERFCGWWKADQEFAAAEEHGHPFHGNQYTEGGGGASESARIQDMRDHIDALKKNKAQRERWKKADPQAFKHGVQWGAEGQSLGADALKEMDGYVGEGKSAWKAGYADGAVFAERKQRGLSDADANSEDNLRHLHLLGATGTVRTEQYDGREHLVVPVIALMEGVIHAVNAETPELVTEATLRKAASSWNGRPVVLGHPMRGGRQCSANDPTIIAERGFGTIFNSRVEGKKLLMDVFIDPKKAEKVGGAKFLADRKAGLPCEVSVGAFVVTSARKGDYNGRAYDGEWFETTGDHLAFLPGGRGACSMDMGCGAHRAAEALITYEVTDTELRVAASDPATVVRDAMRSLLDQAGSSWDDMSALVDELLTTTPATNAERETEKARAVALQSLCMALTSALSGVMSLTYKMVEPTLANGSGAVAMALKAAGRPQRRWHTVADRDTIQAAHDATHTMHDHTKALGANCDAWRLLAAGDCEICQGTGQISEDGKQRDCPACEGTGNLKTAAAGTPHIRAASCGCKGKGDRAMSMTKEQRAELIAALVACEHSGFKEGDEPFLETASDARLEEFRTAGETRKTEAEAKAKLENDHRAVSARVKVLEEKLKTAEAKPTEEEWLAKAPDSIKTLLEKQKVADAEKRDTLVGQLKTAQSEYNEDELKAMDMPALERLSRIAKVAVKDFSGRGVPVHRAAADTADYAPPDSYKASIEAMRTGKAAN